MTEIRPEDWCLVEDCGELAGVAPCPHTPADVERQERRLSPVAFGAAIRVDVRGRR